MLTHTPTLQEKLDIYKDAIQCLIDDYVEYNQVSGMCSVMFINLNVSFEIIDTLEELQSCKPTNKREWEPKTNYWWRLNVKGLLIRIATLEWCIESVKRQIRNENRRTARVKA